MNLLWNLPQIWEWIVTHRKSLIKAVFGLSAGLLLFWSVTLYKQNKKLSESLEIALNNIEAYLGIVSDSQLAFNVLKMDFDELLSTHDDALQKLDSVRQELKIKTKQLHTAATQTLTIDVNASKGVGGLVIVKDSIFNDSIMYNDLTKVYYTIGNDTINIRLDVKNTQYLFIHEKREYKNKKNFLKRLFTLDFKKVTKYKYDIENTNGLLKTSDVRIVESK